MKLLKKIAVKLARIRKSVRATARAERLQSIRDKKEYRFESQKNEELTRVLLNLHEKIIRELQSPSNLVGELIYIYPDANINRHWADAVAIVGILELPMGVRTVEIVIYAGDDELTNPLTAHHPHLAMWGGVSVTIASNTKLIENWAKDSGVWDFNKGTRNDLFPSDYVGCRQGSPVRFTLRPRQEPMEHVLTPDTLHEYVGHQVQHMLTGRGWVTKHVNLFMDRSVKQLVDTILPKLVNDAYSLRLTPDNEFFIPSDDEKFMYSLRTKSSPNAYRLKCDVRLDFAVLGYFSRFMKPNQLRAEFVTALENQLAVHLDDAWDVYASADTWVFDGAPSDSREYIQIAVNFAKK